MDIVKKIQTGRVYFDGSAGTYLQAQGYTATPYELNLTAPEAVVAMHQSYLAAGCDVITANTFGANRLKTENYAAIIDAAIHHAQKAIRNADRKGDRYIALDIGPTGKLLKPLGDLDFEDAVTLFAEVIRAAGDRTDLILIETMNDSLETKAAVLAAKENSKLPIFVTNVFDSRQKLLTGASPLAMIAMLEGLGVDAIGMNCSLGPAQMLPIVQEYCAHASLPVIVNPNAGLPRTENGKTVYDVSAGDFAAVMRQIAQAGATILGGCCGTTPAYIQKLIECTQDLPFQPMTDKQETVISSYTHGVTFGDTPVLIGERINPTGKPRLKEALRNADIDYILNEGIRQQEQGAQVLDVNVGLPEIDEAETMVTAVKELQSVLDLPLQIDTADITAMEQAMRIYNGKPMINSVNGKAESMAAVFPLMKKYGGVAVALTLDENGIPETAAGRLQIAEKIVKTAAEYGVAAKDIIIDPLAMAVSSDGGAAVTALECVKAISQQGGKTILGVSNISFGLPNREVITAAFFTMAMQNGLSAAIMNPHAFEMQKAYHTFLALTGRDPMCAGYIAFAEGFDSTAPKIQPVNAKTADKDADDLQTAIEKGLKERAEQITRRMLAEAEPMQLVHAHIIPALDSVGKGFENKTVYLPQLLMSAEAAKCAFEVIKTALRGKETKRQCAPIVLATVKGDIHDIGKNIVKILLENYGFPVIDLGKDVPPERIVQKALECQSQLVGLSALMTTTVPAMAETIQALHAALPDCKVAVGGAVLTKTYAEQIHADRYCRDAMETVRYAEEILK